MVNGRDHWSSKIGFVLAAAGSAVGLGNIWRFPYITQENGGGAFVSLYLFFVFFFGFPLMVLELSIGRRSESNPVGAFKILGKKKWKYIGYVFTITGISILSYYGVVAGWTLGYFVKSIQGALNPDDFGNFISNSPVQIFYLFLFIFLTALVVSAGVKNGIEKITKFLMPVLLVLMSCLIIRVLFLPKAMEGLKFYLLPDFSKFTIKTVIFAIGQAFFSLSLGMGAMLTYGSYMCKKENLVVSAASVVIFDTVIAFLAGLLIFPVTGGMAFKGGPTLVFVTLIKVFATIPGGNAIAVLFFLLLSIAALTSTVSLLEVATAHFIDDRKWSRKKAVFFLSFLTFLIGIPSALSLGGNTWLSSLLGIGFLGLMDVLFGNLSLSFGALALCLFTAYHLKFKDVIDEIKSVYPDNSYISADVFCNIWKFLISYVVPILSVLIIIYVAITGEGLG